MRKRRKKAIKTRINAPFSYYGGKFYLAKKIVSLLPPHKIYIEPFCGACNVLFAKNPEKNEIINDIDEKVINFFRVLKDENKYLELQKLCALSPFSRTLLEEYYDTLNEGTDVERAMKLFYVFNFTFSGTETKNWVPSVTQLRRNMGAKVSRYLNKIQNLEILHLRLMRVQIDNCDYKECLARYDTKDTLFYMDPVYIQETRTTKNVYKYEMDIEEHKRMVEILLNLKGKVVLSGYDHEVYKPLEEAGWIKKEILVTTRPSYSKSKTYKTECIWIKGQEKRLFQNDFLSQIQK